MEDKESYAYTSFFFFKCVKTFPAKLMWGYNQLMSFDMSHENVFTVSEKRNARLFCLNRLRNDLLQFFLKCIQYNLLLLAI